MARDKTDLTDTALPTTSAKTATAIILTAPDSFGEAEAFALAWLTAVQDAEATGWRVEFRIAWDDAGGFASATITKEFVGFDIKQKVYQAIDALQYDKPIEELKDTLLHVLWEKQHELERKVGRPTGSPWAGTIWTIAHLIKCSGVPLSRNLESSETSAFDAIANAMMDLGIAPNSYSGVKANFYDYANRNGMNIKNNE